MGTGLPTVQGGKEMSTPLTNWPAFADSKNSELLATLKKWGENRNGRGIITRTELVADLNTWLDQQRWLSRPSSPQ
jgi:hypothetical protein